MEPQEIQEHTEHAQHAGEKGIGLTMAVVAVLLAVATLLSHRSHTEEVLLQGKINDQWGFYQAKHTRAHTYGELAEFEALLPNGRATALKNLKISLEEECGVPAEPPGCTSPVLKDSSVLQQLMAEEKAARAGGDHQAHPEHEAGAGKAASGEAETRAAPAAKEEHAAKPEHAAGGKEGKSEKPVKEGAKKIQDRVFEMEHEKDLIQKRADFFDGSELFLEISIVLCSIALLSENKTFWHISFLSTIGGIGVALWGLLLLH